MKHFGTLVVEVAAGLAGLAGPMPGLAGGVLVVAGDGGGVPAAGPEVVCARTGHASSAVVAIIGALAL
jgi:hypothetical protein